MAEFGERLAAHDLGGQVGEWDARRFGDERHGARGARVDFDHEQIVALDGELHVHEADHAQLERHRARGRADLVLNVFAERVRRQDAGRVARVHAGLFDVLHDAADQNVGAVADRVDVDLDRVFEKAVDQDRAVGRDQHGFGHVLVERFVVVHDLHRAAAEHIRRTHEHRIADAARDLKRLAGVARHAVGGLAQAELVEHCAELLAVFGAVDRADRRADQGSAGALEAAGEVERRLAAELHDDALGLGCVDNVHHVFVRERLKEQ